MAGCCEHGHESQRLAVVSRVMKLSGNWMSVVSTVMKRSGKWLVVVSKFMKLSGWML